MNESLRALLEGLIDYAGLFPPAELTLQAAVEEYSALRTSEDAWALGRFLLPVSRLDDLEPFGEVYLRGGPPWQFSILLRGGETASLAHSLREDLRAIDAFQGSHGGRVQVGVVELRMPAVVAEEGAEADRWLDILGEETKGRRLAVFVEPVRSSRWEPAFLHAARGLARLRDASLGPSHGFKLRCGGVTAEAFPDTRQVAHAILLCRDHRVPFKATAGLHHPFRHFHEPLGVHMHGFINVFAGSLLATTGLREPGLTALLGEEHPEAFRFQDDALVWSGREISTREIRDLRQGMVTTFGSCSFAEPRNDLGALGWW